MRKSKVRCSRAEKLEKMAEDIEKEVKKYISKHLMGGAMDEGKKMLKGGMDRVKGFFG